MMESLFAMRPVEEGELVEIFAIGIKKEEEEEEEK